jgi:type III pantothenate kinase
LNERIEKSIENTLRIKAFRITPEVLLNLDMHVPHPYVIGSDLVSNAYASCKLYSKNCLIIDFGTALTFTIAQEAQGISGVTIMPGLKTAVAALFTQTAQLPEVPIALPDSVIGHDTVSAIQSGVMWGYVGAVKEIIHTIKKELNSDLTVIATGGLSEILQPLEKEFNYINRDLTLEGIRFIYQYFQSNNNS